MKPGHSPSSCRFKEIDGGNPRHEFASPLAVPDFSCLVFMFPRRKIIV